MPQFFVDSYINERILAYQKRRQLAELGITVVFLHKITLVVREIKLEFELRSQRHNSLHYSVSPVSKRQIYFFFEQFLRSN